MNSLPRPEAARMRDHATYTQSQVCIATWISWSDAFSPIWSGLGIALVGLVAGTGSKHKIATKPTDAIPKPVPGAKISH